MGLNLRRCRLVALAVGAFAHIPTAGSADLDPAYPAARRPVIPVSPSVPGSSIIVLPPPPATTLFGADHTCHPGYFPDRDGLCRRTGVLAIDCDPSGRHCVPLPPDPVPYGIGAYLRRNY